MIQSLGIFGLRLKPVEKELTTMENANVQIIYDVSVLYDYAGCSRCASYLFCYTEVSK